MIASEAPHPVGKMYAPDKRIALINWKGLFFFSEHEHYFMFMYDLGLIFTM